MNKCIGIGKLLGHKFEARYSYSEPKQDVKISNSSAEDIVNMLEATKSKTYKCDVCVRCGEVINKEDPK